MAGERENKLINVIIEKTTNSSLVWRRIQKVDFDSNIFLRRYYSDNNMAMDTVNCYQADYNNGVIYYTNQIYDGFRELDVQPEADKAITKVSKDYRQLSYLEDAIRKQIDNPEDFLSSLLEGAMEENEIYQ